MVLVAVRTPLYTIHCIVYNIDYTETNNRVHYTLYSIPYIVYTI